MSHEQPLAVDAVPLDVALVRGVAQAATAEQACEAARRVIVQVCGPSELQFVWDVQQPRLLAPQHIQTAPIVPETALLPALRQGEVVAADAGMFIPLLGRGELGGWLYLVGDQAADHTAVLQLIAGQLGPVLALHTAAVAHEERVRQLQTLTEIGRQLSSVLDFEPLLGAIYQAASQVVDASHFYLALYDADAREFSLAFVVHDYVQQSARYRWSIDDGLSGVLLRERTAIYSTDYEAECARHNVKPRKLNDLPPSTAWLGIPLIANDKPVGVMNISSQRPHYEYTPQQIELLTAIGAQAAVALAAAQLYQRSERQARQLAVLNEIGRTITSSLDPEQVPSLIMNQVCRLLGVAEGSLLLTEESSGDLIFAYTNGPVGDQLLGKRVPRGLGIAGHVAQTGESVVVNNVREDQRFYAETDKATGFTTRSLLAVPLRGVGGIQGVIEVMNRRDESDFTHDDRHLLEAIASQAVIALTNAQQFAQVDRALARRAQELAATNTLLQHNLQSLTALNALSMALSTSLRDAEDIYTMTAHGAIAASGAVAATVWLADEAGLRQAVRVGAAMPQAHAEALCRAAMQAGRPQLEQTEPPARLLFAVPLRAPQRVLGALCVCYEHAPNASDQETVVLFATQAAAAAVNNELFTELRGAHDQMASILASTREGIALVTGDGVLAHANDALQRLTSLELHEAHGVAIEQSLSVWKGRVAYPAEEWQLLREKLAMVMDGQVAFASGYLSATTSAAPSLEWVALPVRGSSIIGGGVLLVLRDITAEREAEQLRQDLTNMIVHDLRSPLASVMAAIDMLIRGMSGEMSASQHRVLNIAYNSSVEMLDMISTLLDISRLEDGRMPLALAPTEIGLVINQATERLRTLAQERRVNIVADSGISAVPAFIDRELIVRVVQNLLANAIKFSHSGSSVVIRVTGEQTSAKPMLRISVCDRGIGIAPKDQGHVFAKFGQVGESRGGSGLGLTFCKLAIEAHGGQIWLESEPGLGSTFFFTVPLAD